MEWVPWGQYIRDSMAAIIISIQGFPAPSGKLWDSEMMSLHMSKQMQCAPGFLLYRRLWSGQHSPTCTGVFQWWVDFKPAISNVSLSQLLRLPLGQSWQFDQITDLPPPTHTPLACIPLHQWPGVCWDLCWLWLQGLPKLDSEYCSIHLWTVWLPLGSI